MRAGHGRPLCAGTSDDGRPFVLSKGYDGMPRPTTADRLCCQRAKMACHARRRSTVCAAKRRRWHATPDAVRPCVLPKGDDGMHATPDVVRPCVLPKGDDGMPRPTSLDRVCCPKAMMACHARRRSTVCAAKRRRWHATPDVVRPCVLPKGDDGMPRPTSFNRVCCPKMLMASHARRRSFVFSI